MLHKFRLLLTSILASMILVACGSETNEDQPNVETTDSASEVQVSEESNEAVELVDEASTVETTSTTEEEVTKEEITSEAEAIETAQAEEAAEAEAKAAEEAKQLQEAEAEIGLDITEEIAIEKILAVTGLNPENHSFNLFAEADYVEVEIYEKTDEAVTPLVGVYRFIPETEEVLVRDYLNGAFIPYEEAE